MILSNLSNWTHIQRWTRIGQNSMDSDPKQLLYYLNLFTSNINEPDGPKDVDRAEIFPEQKDGSSGSLSSSSLSIF